MMKHALLIETENKLSIDYIEMLLQYNSILCTKNDEFSRNNATCVPCISNMVSSKYQRWVYVLAL
jgi:hypothetical protein